MPCAGVVWWRLPFPRFGTLPTADVQGVVSLPLRLLGAPWPPPDTCGNATAPTCVLVDPSPSSYTPIRIACVVPPGVGAGFQILIRGIWTSLVPNGVRVGYAPPTVTSVAPARLPITGGNLTLTGAGLGPGPCSGVNRTSDVQVLVTLPPDPGGPQVVFDAATGTWGPTGVLTAAYVPCAVVTWSPTGIVCVAPPGLDAGVQVRVSAGGQAIVVSQRTGYHAPLVSGVVALGPLPTLGGAHVVVTGAGFPPPPWPVAVTVGGAPCVVVDEPAFPRSDAAVVCRVPRGAGRAVVAFATPLQASSGGGTVEVVYASPLVGDVVTPQGRPIEGGFPVIVRGEVSGVCVGSWLIVSTRESVVWGGGASFSAVCVPVCECIGCVLVCACGQNFFPGPVMAVTIGNQPCINVVVTDNVTLGELSCVAPPGPGIGAAQLRVTVAGVGSGSFRFLYTGPEVTQVVGSPCDAAIACPVQVRRRFGCPSSLPSFSSIHSTVGRPRVPFGVAVFTRPLGCPLGRRMLPRACCRS